MLRPEDTKRLLTISPYCVFPPITGGPKRIFHINQGFALNGWEVFQFSGSTKREGSLRSLLSGARELAPGYTEYKYFNPLLHYTNRIFTQKRMPYIGSSILPGSLVNPGILRHQMDRHDFVMLEHPFWYRQTKARRRDNQLLVLDAHNIEFKLFENEVDRDGLMRLAVGHLFALERECFRGVDLAFTCSEDDRLAAIELYGVEPGRIHVAPNGVDVHSVQVASEEVRMRAKRALGLQDKVVALFVGSKWPPNTEAICELVKVAPIRDDVHYLVVGGVGSDFGNTFLPNVTFTGFVDQLQPYLNAADLAVNPMVSGSGSNIKMFEYLAAGLPVVSTAVGARGIRGDSDLCVIEAELTEIPQRIAEVASDKSILGQRRDNARRLAETHYDWTAISQDMSEIMLAAGKTKLS